MHAKAKQVTEFLEKDLLQVIEDTFGHQADQQSTTALAVARRELEEALGADALDGNGLLQEAFAALPAGKRYLEALAKAESAKEALSAEGEIYDHLHRFFERYYEDGDFISRRYFSRETAGRAAPFAIPYNGEEVKLHWANADQYYIKTGEYFANFTVDLAKAPEVAGKEGELGLESRDQPMPVHFRVIDAVEGEHGNVKASDTSKRFFILHADDPAGFSDKGELELRFEYRPDPDKPEKSQEGKWQEELRAQAVERLLKSLADNPEAAAYQRLLTARAPTEANKERTLLAKYLHQYTARNTADYFIHKDLGSFLRRELDFYIKNEVMRLDDIENEDAPRVESYLAKLKVLRTIARQLIAFLAQLEDFQKKLWLKKKFVVETNYGITLDRIPEELYPEIAANDVQREEWVKLYAIHEIEGKASGDLLQAATPGYSLPLTIEFLKSQPHLVLDTRHFPEDFKGRLIATIQNFDELCDGLLVHSENFQALDGISKRFRNTIDVVATDPPYNTGQGDFIYKDSYQSSSWATMTLSRCEAAFSLLHNRGASWITLDDREATNFIVSFKQAVGADKFRGVIAWEKVYSPRMDARVFSTSWDYVISFSKAAGWSPVRQQISPDLSQFPLFAQDGRRYRSDPLRKWGKGSLRQDRPTMWFPIEAPTGDAVWPLKPDGTEGRWRWQKSTVSARYGELDWLDKGNGLQPYVRQYAESSDSRPIETLWSQDECGSTHESQEELKALFPGFDFGTVKPTRLFQKIISCSCPSPQTAIDFFAGSGTTGHAVINLNREDNGRRNYILIEMGDHFDTVLKPRIAKVVYSPDWKDGKPVTRDKGISHCFKYVRLESYEDTLNNLRFTEDAERERALAANDPLRRDYTLNYLLDVETRGSQSLLNLDGVSDPTAYTLKVKKAGATGSEPRPVDLIETFNFLIGLRLVHLAAPQRFTATFQRVPDPDLPAGTDTRLQLADKMRQSPDGAWWFRKVEGWVPKDRENPNNGQKEKVLIVWRTLTGNLEEDNLMLDEWFQKNRLSTRDFEFDTIYVNGSNNLPNLKLATDTWKVRLLEEEFHKAMWDTQDS